MLDTRNNSKQRKMKKNQDKVEEQLSAILSDVNNQDELILDDIRNLSDKLCNKINEYDARGNEYINMLFVLANKKDNSVVNALGGSNKYLTEALMTILLNKDSEIKESRSAHLFEVLVNTIFNVARRDEEKKRLLTNACSKFVMDNFLSYLNDKMKDIGKEFGEDDDDE